MANPPDEETLEVDWPCHPPRSFHCKNCYALDARREMQAGSPQDHMATDSWEGNKGDGEDLGGHQVHGKGSPDVEGTRCCPTCLLGVKGMNEWMNGELIWQARASVIGDHFLYSCGLNLCFWCDIVRRS